VDRAATQIFDNGADDWPTHLYAAADWLIGQRFKFSMTELLIG